MEILILIFIILVIIAYQLDRLNAKNSYNEIDGYSKASSNKIKRPAFSEKEWDKAVADWYESQYLDDMDSGLILTPFHSVWQPPDYEEVKYEIYKLRNLQMMAKRDK